MQIRDKVVVITGGASGIGAALARRFAAEGARGIAVADRDEQGAAEVAESIDGLAVPTDVCAEEDMRRLVDRTTDRFGAIDLFCSNAGIDIPGGVEVDDAQWERIWKTNVMAHVYAARAVLPGMVERGGGYFLQTVSAAGLLTHLGSAPYSVTKHAALGLAEWLSICHADQGIKVTCICPQGVQTPMLMDAEGGLADFLRAGSLTPEQIADAAVEGIAEERFLVLPHAEVAEYFRHKADDYERWLAGMRRLNASLDS